MKSKAVEYTIFEDKFQMPEYTTFQDGGSNSLSHEKSDTSLLFQIPIQKMDFLTKPTLLAVIHSPSFPSVCIAATAACARKITVHLC
jgi:hypothetical protein